MDTLVLLGITVIAGECLRAFLTALADDDPAPASSLDAIRPLALHIPGTLPSPQPTRSFTLEARILLDIRETGLLKEVFSSASITNASFTDVEVKSVGVGPDFQSERQVESVTNRAPKTCAVCREDIDGHCIQLECLHTYDLPCLIQLFWSNKNNEAMFPPRCCGQQIPLGTLRRSWGETGISANLLNEFEAKATEYETPNRVYCSVPSCSRFLGAKQDSPSDIACECGTRTCSACSEMAHAPLACPNVKSNVLQMLLLAESQGWQRCPGCHGLVERIEGCRHMTCRCGVGFCYFCSAKWRTCQCPPDGPGVRQREHYLLDFVEEYSRLGTIAPPPPPKRSFVKTFCKKAWRKMRRRGTN